MLLRRAGKCICKHGRTLWLLLLVLLPFSSAWCQQFTFSDFGVGSGLTNLNVMNLLEDQTGLVWAGTQSGVFTADGASFQKIQAFTDAGLDYIRALREDKAGRVWAIDGHHLVYWQRGQIKTITDAHFKVLSNDALDLVVAPDGSDGVYLLHAGELLFVSSENHGAKWSAAPAFSTVLLAHFPELGSITSIVAGPHGALWMSCGSAICVLDTMHHSVQRYGEEQGVHADTWRTLAMTRSGCLWARGEHSILFQAKGQKLFSQVSSLPEGFSEDVRWPLLTEDPQGRMILNLTSGIAIGGKEGWHVFNAQNGLPDDEIEALLFDRSGTLWLSSSGHGVQRWQGYGNWEGWNKKDGLSSNVIWSIARGKNGQYWITSDKGLNDLDTGSSRVSPVPALHDRLFPVVADPRGHIWTADRTGTVYDFDPTTKHTRVAATDLKRVFRLHRDRRDRVWVCSRKGLFYFSQEDGWLQAHAVEQRELLDTYAWTMAEGPDGTLWLATGKGLFRLDGDTWKEINLPVLPGRARDNFMLAVASDGTLWMQNWQPFPMIHLKVQGTVATVIDRLSGNFMTSDNITFVESDRRGWIWVGTDAGVYVSDGKRWVKCSAQDGLIWDDTDFHAFLADPDGSVWIGTSAGVSHILRPELLFAAASPRVRLVDVNVSGQLITRDAQSFDLRKPTLSFHFLNTNYSRGAAIRQKYRLDGEDSDWQETDSSLVRFPSLAAGKYKLEVVAYDDRLQSSSQREVIAFTVLEPWWKRPWFITLEAVCCLLLLLAIWRLSVHLLVARQLELERLVMLRTQELEAEKKELLHARSSLLEVTRRDALTGLLNRSAIFQSLAELCESSRSSGVPIAVVMADLDSFKRINDNYGHLAGDAVLRECAARIMGATRPIDAVGRYGGEELLILMPGLPEVNLKQRMEQLRASIANEPIMYQQQVLNVSCSFGVAWLNDDACTIESLVSQADSALYLAKQNGRNRVEYAELVQV